jgi:hypothetical protein
MPAPITLFVYNRPEHTRRALEALLRNPEAKDSDLFIFSDGPKSDEAAPIVGRARQELRLVNLSAVTSLDEGFEETLTLHRLGVFAALGISLKTTNCLESLNAQLGQMTDKVDRWRTSDQKHRWVASALLAIEPRLRRIKGYRHLPLLQSSVRAAVCGQRREESQIA